MGGYEKRVLKAKAEAERFWAAADKYLNGDLNNCRNRAAMKCSSMDLSRALADIRRILDWEQD